MANPAAVTEYNSWVRSTAGGIRYKLLDGPHIEQSDEGTTASETIMLRAVDAAAFSAESMPPPYVLGFFTFLPNRRRMAGAPYLVTKRISFKPWGDGVKHWDPMQLNDGLTYNEFCECSISYETSQESEKDRDPNDPTTFLEHSLNVGGELYVLSTIDRWHDVAGVATELTSTKDMPGSNINVVTMEHNLKWPMAMSPDWATITERLGTVNDSQKELFNNAAEETVLFSAISGTQKYIWNGAAASVRPWSLDFKFSQRCKTAKDGTAITWNHCIMPKAKTGADAKWIKPYYKDGGTEVYMYEATDLYDLFKTS